MLGFYICSGRRYDNHGILPIFSDIFAAYTTRLATSALGRWVPGCSVCCYCDVAVVSLSEWPNVGRWPKRAGCRSVDKRL